MPLGRIRFQNAGAKFTAWIQWLVLSPHKPVTYDPQPVKYVTPALVSGIDTELGFPSKVAVSSEMERHDLSCSQVRAAKAQWSHSVKPILAWDQSWGKKTQ
jgi:hypothetical protein